ncbi:phage portal protein [Pleomorphomonas oryzae]|uniref:phage portal protein n=1 Tax=Pleomorphomonas oryzae TaxID=261934 RepID=UPI00040A1D83|nr:phage portal protein [Pleomorphomonas oryzae]
MGLLGKLQFWKSERKATSEDIWRELYGGRRSKSGQAVNWENALKVTTVLACARVLGNGVAQIPLKIMRESGGRRVEATDHQLYKLFRFKPNSWQTPSEFKRMIVWHMVLAGNAFVWIGRVGNARRIVALEPIEPSRVTVRRSSTGTLTYEVRADDGSYAVMSSAEIWHLRAPSWNGWMGLDSVKLAREAIGLALATEEAHAEFHANGAKVSGVYSVDGKMGKEQYELITQFLEKHATGGKDAGKPLVLDMGAKWQQQQMTGVDAQHLETRRFQIEENCRAFGVMPIMIGHADKTQTYASSEQQFQAHVVHALSPIYVYVEESINAFLIGEADFDAGVYAKFFPNGLLRGVAKDRSEFYAKALGSGGTKGWMTQNEVRDAEDMDPSDEPEANKLPQPTTKPVTGSATIADPQT